MPDRGRYLRFALLVVFSIALAVGYVGWAAARDRSSAARSGIHTAGGASLAGTRSAQARAAISTAAGPLIVFRSLLGDGSFGKVAVTPLASSRSQWRVSDLRCDRVYFAGGRGLCLAAASNVAPVSVARIFGPDFGVMRELRLDGLASRARVSPDGRYGATTTFVYGHSYSDGSFSTQATLIDMASGKSLGDLEQFHVTRAGKPFAGRDFNFWGVTFARDPNRFYATLRTGGKTYLVEGDVHARTARTLLENVECPSLSPDGTRIAFKRQVGEARGNWRLNVLDLRTMKARPLAETRVVDDQVEWLDNRRILYWRANTVWVVPADGTGAPSEFVSNASSPVVAR